MQNPNQVPDIVRVEKFEMTQGNFKPSDVNERLAAGWLLLGVMIDRRILEGDAYYSFETYILGLPRTPENEQYAKAMLEKEKKGKH
jgi:hypothetical protein